MGYTTHMATKNLKYIVGEDTFNTNNSAEVRYMALSSTEPNIDGTNVTEPEGNNYARVIIGASGYNNTLSGINHFGDVELDEVNKTFSITNVSEIHFNEVIGGSWGTLKWFAIYTSATGGTPLYIGALESAITPNNNTVPLIRKGSMKITLA